MVGVKDAFCVCMYVEDVGCARLHPPAASASLKRGTADATNLSCESAYMTMSPSGIIDSVLLMTRHAAFNVGER
jgi:hypothetical protein